MRFVVIVFACVVLNAYPALANILNIEERVTQAGHHYWFIQDDFAPVLSLSLGFEGGSALDPADQQGLSLFMADMMTEGAGERDATEFSRALNNHAISLSASAGRDAVTISMKTTLQTADVAMELLRDILTQARFEETDIERIRAGHLARLKNALKQPSWRATRLMLHYAYPDHPYGRNSGGTLSSLQAIDRDAIYAHYRSTLTANRLKMSVVGAVTGEEADHYVDMLYADLPAGQVGTVLPADFLQKDQSVFHALPGPQSTLLLAWEAPDKMSPDDPASLVLAQLLGGGFGSLLMQTIREEKGLTYGIYASSMRFDQGARFMIQSSAQHDNVPMIMAETERILIDLADNGPDEAHIQDAISYLVGSYPLSLTSTDRISGHMLSLYLDGKTVDAPDQWVQDVENVTADDIQRLAKVMVQGPRLSIWVGQQPTAGEWKEIEELPNVE